MTLQASVVVTKSIAQTKNKSTSFEPESKSEFSNEMNSFDAKFDTKDFFGKNKI